MSKFTTATKTLLLNLIIYNNMSEQTGNKRDEGSQKVI